MEIDKLDNKTIFWYSIVFCIILLFFSKFTVGLNIVFGFFIGFIIILYLYYNHMKLKEEQNKIILNERQILTPQPDNAMKYNNIVDFLFSIQDLYIYNPQAYEDMIEIIDQFFKLYEESNNDNSLAGMNYYQMIIEKNNAMNSLQSIICLQIVIMIKN